MARLTDKKVQDILDELSYTVKSLTACCKKHGIVRQAFWARVVKSEASFSAYMRAKQKQQHLTIENHREMMEELEKLVNNDEMDEKTKQMHIQVVKLKLDNEKWIVSKLLPKIYGQKLDVTSDEQHINAPVILPQNGKESDRHLKIAS